MARKPNAQPAADDAATAVVSKEAATASDAASGPTPDPETGTEGQAAAAGEGAPSSAEASALQMVPSLIVTGPRAGRRRTGRQFGPQPVTIALSDLSEAEIAALTGDPSLTVVTVDAPY
jgi:hypothetical protein